VAEVERLVGPDGEPLAASAMPDELLALAEASARASRSCAPRGPGVNAARMLLSYGATELRSYVPAELRNHR